LSLGARSQSEDQTAQPDRALEGITVVSIEQAVSAPFATRQLADLGARVIKIERPDRGDFARDYDDMVLGTAAHFVWLNRGKESLALNLKSDKGRRILQDLIAGADVFIQNLAPGAAARLGCASEALHKANPRLIVVELSGYGAEGPYSDRKAYDMLIQAESGLISVTGSADNPARVGVPVADISAAMNAFSGTLAALFRRARSGAGATLEITMLDSLAEWMSHPMYYTHYRGYPPPRTNLTQTLMAPYGAFPTADGIDVMIGIQNDRGWRQLATEILNRPELVGDPAYATNMARVNNRDQVNGTVAEVTGRLSVDELTQRLDRAGIPYGRINTPAELSEHAQLSARDRWRSIETPGGAVDALLPPITFSDVEANMGGIPALGEHTGSILSEAGWSADEIAGLRRDEVVK
jgi:crotonobetainyl-CoA:carnitine CoA-transferase CaiB-like acyl-CoA transferase